MLGAMFGRIFLFAAGALALGCGGPTTPLDPPDTTPPPPPPWSPSKLRSESGQFGSDHLDELIAGTWEAIRIDEHAASFSAPFSLEFLPSEGVTVEEVVGAPFRFHAHTVGTARVPFRATDAHRTIEDAFLFNVVKPVSFDMGACDRVLGGFGLDVGFVFNGWTTRLYSAPQGLLPVEVQPPDAAVAIAHDGYLATRFQLHVTDGFMGSIELRSTLGDDSSKIVTAIDPRSLLKPALFTIPYAPIGKKFVVGVAPMSPEGVVCSPIPVTLVAAQGAACHVVGLQAPDYYMPFNPPGFEVIGDVIGGTCELVVQYDRTAIDASFGSDWAANLPADSPVLSSATIVLDIEIVDSTTPTPGGGGGGWGDFD
jgi:hypothetical protein